MTEAIEIVLATYNGEQYLDDFFQSLERQTFSDWRVLARDDGSSDQTLGKLHQWEQKLGKHRLRIIPNDESMKLGTAGNFGHLLKECHSNYAMMADQDDVWLPEKIMVTMAAMKQLENRVGPERACLVNTDSILVDSSLRLLHQSKWQKSSLHPDRFRWLGRHLIENTAQGCTLMMNRALFNLVGEIPSSCLYADWYIALVAFAFGHIESIRCGTVLWRRHQSNTTNTNAVFDELIMALTGPIRVRQKVCEVYEAGLTHAQVFRERYFSLLNRRDQDVLTAFCSFGEMGFWEKRWAALNYGFCFTSIRRSMGFFLFM